MVETSASFDPVETSRATPAGQAKAPLAPATTTAPNLGPSEQPLADLGKPSMASVIQQYPQSTDESKSIDSPRSPLGHPDSAGPSVRPTPNLLDAQHTAVPWNGVLQQPYDPSQDSPIQTSEALVSAVLVALPEIDNPSDAETVAGESGGIDSEDHNLPSANADTRLAVSEYVPTLISGYVVAAAPSGGIVFASSSVANGVQATIHGHIVSAGSSSVVIDSSTYALPGLPVVSPNPNLVLDVEASSDGAILISNSVLPVDRATNGGIVIGSSTIAVGHQAAVDGHTYSVGVSSIAVDGIFYSLPRQLFLSPVPTPVLVSGNPILAEPNGDILIASSTVTVGDRATVGGHIISAGSSNVVVDGSTYARSFSANARPAQTGPPDLTATSAGTAESVAAQIRDLIMGGLRNGLKSSVTDRLANASKFPASMDSEMTATRTTTSIGSQTTSIVDTARGTQSPASTGGSQRNSKDVWLLHFTSGLYVVGVALAVL